MKVNQSNVNLNIGLQHMMSTWKVARIQNLTLAWMSVREYLIGKWKLVLAVCTPFVNKICT